MYGVTESYIVLVLDVDACLHLGEELRSLLLGASHQGIVLVGFLIDSEEIVEHQTRLLADAVRIAERIVGTNSSKFDSRSLCWMRVTLELLSYLGVICIRSFVGWVYPTCTANQKLTPFFAAR